VSPVKLVTSFDLMQQESDSIGKWIQGK